MIVGKKKRGRPSQQQRHLTAESIVSCARQLMRDNGKVPSIRQLSGALGVDAMSIYHYYANKNALLEALTVSLIDDIYEPVPAADWQQQLQRLCKSYLALLGAHSGLLEIMLSMSAEGPAQVFSERLSVALKPLQLNQPRFEQVRDLLADYLHGVALAIKCNPGASMESSINGSLQLIYAGLSAQSEVEHL